MKLNTALLSGIKPHAQNFRHYTAATITLLLTLLSVTTFGQVIRNYMQNNNVKNYAIEERPGTSGNQFVMAGTIFDNNIPSDPNAAVGRGIHFMRVDGQGKTMLYAGTPSYIVSMRYNFNAYTDVRCVDIVPNTNKQSIIIAQARHVVDPSNFLVNKDVVLVLRVDNESGTLLSTTELSYPGGTWMYDNIYATHAIVHKDNNNSQNYLYICGYDAIETSYPNYPEYTPHAGPSCFDKRILVMKYDLTTNTVVCSRTWDYPWPTCSVNPPSFPYIWDFDIAMRLIPMSDGTGDIYVTGSTNSDYAYDYRYPPVSMMIPASGAATLSLRIDETNVGPNGLNTVAVRPFIEHIYPNLGDHYETYEHGFGAFEDNTGNGLYVFSNRFAPGSANGYGMTNYGPTIKMTYINKATLGFNPYPDMHRMMWGAIDYDWGTQVIPSANGGNKLYLTGLQFGWDATACGSPTSPSLTPNWLNNTNPFYAELEPSWTPGSPSTIGLTSTNFWKVFFTMNGTGYFNSLGGGFSNPYWATESAANSATTTGPVFTSPSWNPNANISGGLNHKFNRTDANGNLPITSTQCDNAYMNCAHTYVTPIDITDAWVFNTHVEDQPTVNTMAIAKEEVFYPISYDPYCNEPGFTPMYKTTGVSSANNADFHFDVYPNPAKDYVFVTLNGSIADENIKIELTNILGQQVAELYNGKASAINDNPKLSLGNTAKGTYILKISSKGKTLYTNKLIVQ